MVRRVASVRPNGQRAFEPYKDELIITRNV